MNKKISKLIEKEGPTLIEIEESLKWNNLTEDAVQDEITNEMDKRCGKLVHFYSSDLNAALVDLRMEETDVEKKALQIQRNNQEVEQEDIQHLQLLNMQIRVIEYAITKKKQYRSKPSTDHMLEQTLVEYPIFSSSFPSEEVINRMRKDGALIQFRDGYRRMYFKNDMGKLLGYFEARVLAGLSLLWKKNGSAQELTFDFRVLAEAMYIMDPEGGDYNQILLSLKKLYSSSFVTERFLDAQGLIREGTKYVHIFSEMDLIGKQGRERAATLKLADFFHQNLLEGRVVHLNLLLFNDFESNTTKTLYPFILSLLEQNRQEYRLEMDMLIKQFNISQDNPTKARGILKNAFDEMATAQIISTPDQKKLAGNYFIYFKPPEQLGMLHGNTEENIKQTEG